MTRLKWTLDIEKMDTYRRTRNVRVHAILVTFKTSSTFPTTPPTTNITCTNNYCTNISCPTVALAYREKIECLRIASDPCSVCRYRMRQ